MTPSYNQTFKRLMLAGVLAGMAVATQAQTPPQPPEASHGPRHSPAQMQERMAERQAKLKADLKITATQEAAWSSFAASMQPPARTQPRIDREELRKLSTPQRVERMQALRAERNAHMDQRDKAVLQFYAALTPEQQKLFDARSARMDGPHGPHGHRGPGHPMKG